MSKSLTMDFDKTKKRHVFAHIFSFIFSLAFLISISILVFAIPVCVRGEETLFTNTEDTAKSGPLPPFTSLADPQTQSSKENENHKVHKVNKISVQKMNKNQTEPIDRQGDIQGNLPMSYHQGSRRDANRTTAAQVITPKNVKESLRGLFVGDILEADILHSIMAFPNDKSPVVAEVTSQQLSGARVLGFSRLEPNSKRITIEFVFITKSQLTFKILASALAQDGTQGLEGRYHSQEGKLFSGVFLSSMTAAYFDSLIPRTTNIFGEVQKQISPGDAATQGLAAGAIATADEFRKKLSSVPEFSELHGPIKIKLMILEIGDKLQ